MTATDRPLKPDRASESSDAFCICRNASYNLVGEGEVGHGGVVAETLVLV
jgi:hypothetical protein